MLAPIMPAIDPNQPMPEESRKFWQDYRAALMMQAKVIQRMLDDDEAKRQKMSQKRQRA